MMIGRPRKYKERIMPVSLALEPSLLQELSQKANDAELSRNEYITGLIVGSDKELAQTLIKEYSAMKQALARQQATTKNYAGELQKIRDNGMTGFIFEPLENIPELTPLIKTHKEHLLKNKKDNELWKKGLLLEQPISTKLLVEDLSRQIFNDFSDSMIKKGKMIKNKRFVLAVIKKELFEVLE